MADLVTTIALDDREFRTGLQRADAAVNASATRMERLGRGIGGAGRFGAVAMMAVTTAVGIATRAVKEYATVNDEVARQLARIKDTSGDLWKSIGADVQHALPLVEGFVKFLRDNYPGASQALTEGVRALSPFSPFVDVGMALDGKTRAELVDEATKQRDAAELEEKQRQTEFEMARDQVATLRGLQGDRVREAELRGEADLQEERKRINDLVASRALTQDAGQRLLTRAQEIIDQRVQNVVEEEARRNARTPQFRGLSSGMGGAGTIEQVFGAGVARQMIDQQKEIQKKQLEEQKKSNRHLSDLKRKAGAATYAP